MGAQKKKIVIIGGGAAGYFTAANLTDVHAEILILEQAKTGLQKVKISGGGRCNVTHACFDPRELVGFYPRGHKALRSCFTRFQPGDTMAWFEERGLELKVEADNRVFPVTDSAQSVIDILEREALKNGVVLQTQSAVTALKQQGGHWKIVTKTEEITADYVVFCTGSSPKAYKLLAPLNLELVPLVPSLFTFNIQHQLLDGLMGTSFAQASVKIPDLKAEEYGPLLITHWGLSGPAVLKLSAWCARELADLGYRFPIQVNFINHTFEEAMAVLTAYKTAHGKQQLGTVKLFNLTQRFWQHLLTFLKLDAQQQLANLNKKNLQKLAQSLTQMEFVVNGKSTFKEEFVTAGGVALPQIDFRSMRVRSLTNFYMAGEVLDIDAVTGGFNFQACWSEGWLIAQDLKAELNPKD